MATSELPRRVAALVVGCVLALSLVAAGVTGAAPQETFAAAPPDFERMARDQARTDEAWRAASRGMMRMEKIFYRSRAGDLDIPAFLFEPLTSSNTRSHPGLVWVHENIRGHLYEHYIPYVRDAVGRGYVVIAPEYRGSIGYGRAFYDAIDYGGAEVDDVASAADALALRSSLVDPEQIAVIGWSHGGMIALLAVTRERSAFKAAAAVAPVTNLFHRMARKGAAHLQVIDPHRRFGGLPHQRPEAYTHRSPLFHLDKLSVPVLVHLADNDDDVNIEEGMQLVDALRARKPHLAVTKVYESPPGGHMFDRRVEPRTWRPEDSPAQRDSWERVWAFLDAVLVNGRAATELQGAASR